VVHGNDQVLAAKSKESCFVEGIDYGKSLAFYWGISCFGCMGETAVNKSGLPARETTEWVSCCAAAVLLEEPEANASF
jgi:hypothetical protein